MTKNNRVILSIELDDNHYDSDGFLSEEGLSHIEELESTGAIFKGFESSTED